MRLGIDDLLERALSLSICDECQKGVEKLTVHNDFWDGGITCVVQCHGENESFTISAKELMEMQQGGLEMVEAHFFNRRLTCDDSAAKGNK